MGTFFNVAFLGAVEQHLRGETPTVAGGLRFARARIRRILVWALLATGVGLALRALAQLPIGDWVSSLLSFLGGLAWTAATLFVVPILVLEDVSAPKAVKQSARVFRQRYGEGITGQLSIGVVTGVSLLPTFILGGVAVAVGGASITVAALLGLVAAVWFLCVTVVSGAVGSLFTLLLYREATEGTVLGPLTGIAPEDVLSRRRRASWRRRT